MPPKPKQRLLVIDGHALIHRSFHGIPPLNNAAGEPVNAVYGFALTLLKAWKDLKPTHIIAAFDLKEKTFRHEFFEAYKAGRQKTADELLQQVPRVKEMVRSFGIPIFELAGFEADDLIGTISCLSKPMECIILTGDMDTMQLVNRRVKVYTMRKGMTDTALYDEAGVQAKYAIRPDQVIDYKALRGDPSDNIPGVKGVGEKTATELLRQFDSLERLYTALADNTPAAQGLKESLREKLLTFKSDAFLSQRLATIDCHVPMTFDIADAKMEHYDREKVVSLFRELNFTSLLTKLPPTSAGYETADDAPAEPKPLPDRSGYNYTLVNDEETWEKFFTQLQKQSAFAIDTETTELDPLKAELLGLSFSWKENQGWYVVAKPEWLTALKPILEDPKRKKIGHNMKFDASMLRMQGISMTMDFDTMLASYLLHSGTRQHSLDSLVFVELGHEMMPITELIGPRGKKQISLKEVPLEKVSWYSCEDADYTWRLYNVLEPKLRKSTLLKLFQDIEMPTVKVLVDMELAGIKVDTDFLRDMSKKIHITLTKTEHEIEKLAGEPFNINSPLQLQKILFERLKISTQGLGKTKTGVSTAAEQLEKIRDAHPIIPLITQQRELTKLLSTYIDALPEMVNEKTGRVHTSYNQAVAATGRLSSVDPNLQNIPIRTELGAEIRKAFVAERGFRLLSADYSQIELRVIASIAEDDAMIASFKRGEDIHTRTAANIHGIEIDQVTPAMRRAAKAVNFGVIYGLGYVGLSQAEGISRAEAKEFIEKYFTIYHRIRSWLDATKKLAHAQGYVETLFGRRRYFPDISSSNGMLVASAERQAINAPIQGTAADLVKMAMIAIHRDLPAVSPKSRLLLQVHDEVVLEVPKDDIEVVSAFLKKTMENIYTLRVPIVADVKDGRSWGEAK